MYSLPIPKPNSPPARPYAKHKTRLSGNHIHDSETSVWLAERIAEGGQGQVYRAKDSTGVEVAVKVLDRPYNAHHHAAILNEIKIWSSVSDDPLVPTLRRVIEDDCFIYLVSVRISNIRFVDLQVTDKYLRTSAALISSTTSSTYGKTPSTHLSASRPSATSWSI